jgi:serine protease Do
MRLSITMNSVKTMKKRSALKQILAIVFITTGLLIVSYFYLSPNTFAKDVGKNLLPDNLSTLAETVSPAVVNIRTVKTIKGGGRVFRHFSGPPFGNGNPGADPFRRFFGEDRRKDFKQRSLGTGFIIDKDGYIVTNNHVVENADKIKVKLKNGTEYDAKIIGRDPSTDLALIKITPKNGLPVVSFGSSDQLKVGQWVLAIGSPFGLEHTVTTGIVSAKGRVIGSGPYDDFIQTDASINPGNSGGPLLDMEGKVVGINTAIIASGQGIGFAIPVDLAKGVIDQLKNHGNVTRGWLGVGIQDVNQEISGYYGLEENQTGTLVTAVFPGDPAEKAGIEQGDIIIEVNGKDVSSSRDLTGIIANIGVGDKAKVKVLRNGKEKNFNVKIAKREDSTASVDDSTNSDKIGIHVSGLTQEIARRFNLDNAKGVIVDKVLPESKGYNAGIQTGDIIKEINRTTIATTDDYEKEIRKVEKDKSISMLILRKNRGFIVVKLTK